MPTGAPRASDAESRPVVSPSVLPTAPFEPGSVSLRLYPHNELPADAIVSELCAQAGLAFSSGFDGVMISEHHGGFAGYMAQPLQMASFVLAEHATGWAAAAPLLLPAPVHGAGCRGGRLAPRSSSRAGSDSEWPRVRYLWTSSRLASARPMPSIASRRNSLGSSRCSEVRIWAASRRTRRCWRADGLRSPCSAQRCRLPPPYGPPGAEQASSWRACQLPRDSPA